MLTPKDIIIVNSKINTNNNIIITIIAFFILNLLH